jgi:prolipoprotein diacylglyceryltransferase
MVRQGYQTAAGFLITNPFVPVVYEVEPGSAAERAGLKPGDVIIEAEGKLINSPQQVEALLQAWPRGENTLDLLVRRGATTVDLSFVPGTIGLHPTQIYESISTGLLLFLLLSYFPFRRHDGELFLLLMLGYAVHRFLNESIRIDTDRYAFGLTLSQHISLIVLVTAVGLGIWLVRRPPRTEAPLALQPEVAPAESKASDAPETALQD